MKTVRQEDLDAWRGQPVVKLDSHPIFASMDLRRTIAQSGVETRNYRNASAGARMGRATTSFSQSSAETHYREDDTSVVCNNVFVIKNGRVLSYTPVGQCYTDQSLQPPE